MVDCHHHSEVRLLVVDGAGAAHRRLEQPHLRQAAGVETRLLAAVLDAAVIRSRPSLQWPAADNERKRQPGQQGALLPRCLPSAPAAGTLPPPPPTQRTSARSRAQAARKLTHTARVAGCVPGAAIMPTVQASHTRPSPDSSNRRHRARGTAVPRRYSALLSRVSRACRVCRCASCGCYRYPCALQHANQRQRVRQGGGRAAAVAATGGGGGSLLLRPTCRACRALSRCRRPLRFLGEAAIAAGSSCGQALTLCVGCGVRDAFDWRGSAIRGIRRRRGSGGCKMLEPHFPSACFLPCSRCTWLSVHPRSHRLRSVCSNAALGAPRASPALPVPSPCPDRRVRFRRKRGALRSTLSCAVRACAPRAGLWSLAFGALLGAGASTQRLRTPDMAAQHGSCVPGRTGSCWLRRLTPRRSRCLRFPGSADQPPAAVGRSRQHHVGLEGHCAEGGWVSEAQPCVSAELMERAVSPGPPRQQWSLTIGSCSVSCF